MRGLTQVLSICFISMFLLPHCANTARADELIWPQFRGPNCSGLAATGQNPPVDFGPTQNVLWKTPVLRGHSSPCIWGDHIFLTGFDKEKKQLQVFCVERSSGEIRWSRVVPAEQIEKVHTVGSPATSTPITNGERVYVYFGSYGLLCYDVAGQLQWTAPMPIPNMKEGHCTSPVIAEGLVVLSGHEEQVPHLLAFDMLTGERKWMQAEPRARWGELNHSTPVVWNKEIVIHRGGEIVAHSLADGRRLWWISTETRGISTPAVGNNCLHVGTWNHSGEPELRMELPTYKELIAQYDTDGDGLMSLDESPDDLVVLDRPEVGDIEEARLYLKKALGVIDANKDAKIAAAEWKGALTMLAQAKDHGLMTVKPGGKGDITMTHVQWLQKENVPEVPSPLYCNGHVYMVNNGGRVSCIEADTGKLLYHRQRLGASGPYYASPISAGDLIYAVSGKGVVTVFSTGGRLKILARNNLGEAVFATPAIVDNKLYVRTTKHMYSFGK